MATLFERMSEALKGGYQGQILPDLTWQGVEDYLARQGGQRGAPGQDSLDALIAAALGGGGAGGGYRGGYGGGGGGVAVDQGALMRLQSELDSLELAKQQAFDAGQTDLARQFEAQQAALMREFQTGERIRFGQVRESRYIC